MDNLMNGVSMTIMWSIDIWHINSTTVATAVTINIDNDKNNDDNNVCLCILALYYHSFRVARVLLAYHHDGSVLTPSQEYCYYSPSNQSLKFV